mgnify:CR=1 FL=1
MACYTFAQDATIHSEVKTCSLTYVTPNILERAPVFRVEVVTLNAIAVPATQPTFFGKVTRNSFASPTNSVNARAVLVTVG